MFSPRRPQGKRQLGRILRDGLAGVFNHHDAPQRTCSYTEEANANRLVSILQSSLFGWLRSARAFGTWRVAEAASVGTYDRAARPEFRAAGRNPRGSDFGHRFRGGQRDRCEAMRACFGRSREYTSLESSVPGRVVRSRPRITRRTFRACSSEPSPTAINFWVSTARGEATALQDRAHRIDRRRPRCRVDGDSLRRQVRTDVEETSTEQSNDQRL
jgi:hypothetical protein